ncbi:MAG: hypothetical protein KJ601_04010 [Nanoarchaeota archaeon]|nr:hypothetical protein [Nanoarchaeota archaeon]MBU1703999.1 hypothetical protein [Nanoarchaeota archaeon]
MKNKSAEAERDVYFHLLKLHRFLEIVKKIFYQKKRVYSRAKDMLEERSLFAKILKRNPQKDFVSILSRIKRQLKLLLEDLDIGIHEEERLTKIKELGFFGRFSESQAQLLMHVVYLERDKITEMVRQLKQIIDDLKQQERIIKGLIRRYSFSEFEKLEPLLDSEQKSINSVSTDSSILIGSAKRILDDLEKLKTQFNSHDLELLGKEISDLRKVRDKSRFVSELLSGRRKLTGKIDTNSLIAVHITDYFPKNGVIIPAGRYGLNFEGKVYPWPRNTIHFALNSAVSDHWEGAAWSQMAYAILVPLNLIFSKVRSIWPEDTYVFGSLQLPRGAEIIVANPDHEPKYYQEKAGGLAVLFPKKGESLFECIRRRITERGFTFMRMSKSGWMSHVAGGPFNEAGWQESFKEFAGMTDKGCGLHAGDLLGKIEELARNSIWILEDDGDYMHEKYRMAQGALDGANKYKQELAREAKSWKLPEEREAYHHIDNFLEQLIRSLKQVRRPA